MQRTVLALLAPPTAVFHFGAAGPTAAPIAVFWLTGMVSLAYGIDGGVRGLTGPSAPEILLGVALWLIAGVWARLVIRGVEHDLVHDNDSTHDHQIEPHADEPDPLSLAQR